MDPNLYGYVLNDPVNLVDPLGLKGGAFIPIRYFIKRNITGGNIIAPILEKGLAIPTSVFGILTFDYLNPKVAGDVSEEFLIYQWEKTHYPNSNDFNIQPPSVIDTLTVPVGDTVLESEPCK